MGSTAPEAECASVVADWSCGYGIGPVLVTCEPCDVPDELMFHVYFCHDVAEVTDCRSCVYGRELASFVWLFWV